MPDLVLILRVSPNDRTPLEGDELDVPKIRAQPERRAGVKEVVGARLAGENPSPGRYGDQAPQRTWEVRAVPLRPLAVLEIEIVELLVSGRVNARKRRQTGV